MTAKETTPVKAGAVSVPYGHVIGNEKWRGSQIAQGLQGKHVNKAQKYNNSFQSGFNTDSSSSSNLLCPI